MIPSLLKIKNKNYNDEFFLGTTLPRQLKLKKKKKNTAIDT